MNEKQSISVLRARLYYGRRWMRAMLQDALRRTPTPHELWTECYRVARFGFESDTAAHNAKNN